jgi:hypothetical protein
MTDELKALVEKVAAARWNRRWPNFPWHAAEYEGSAECRADALAAIRCVAEATREASEGMRRAYDAPPAEWPGSYASRDWRAMHAASVLGEAMRDAE